MAGVARSFFDAIKTRLEPQFPELGVDEPKNVFEVDRARREAGAQPTTLGAATENAYIASSWPSEDEAMGAGRGDTSPYPSPDETMGASRGAPPTEQGFFSKYLFEPVGELGNFSGMVNSTERSVRGALGQTGRQMTTPTFTPAVGRFLNQDAGIPEWLTGGANRALSPLSVTGSANALQAIGGSVGADVGGAGASAGARKLGLPDWAQAVTGTIGGIIGGGVGGVGAEFAGAGVRAGVAKGFAAEGGKASGFDPAQFDELSQKLKELADSGWDANSIRRARGALARIKADAANVTGDPQEWLNRRIAREPELRGALAKTLDMPEVGARGSAAQSSAQTEDRLLKEAETQLRQSRTRRGSSRAPELPDLGNDPFAGETFAQRQARQNREITSGVQQPDPLKGPFGTGGGAKPNPMDPVNLGNTKGGMTAKQIRDARQAGMTRAQRALDLANRRDAREIAAGRARQERYAPTPEVAPGEGGPQGPTYRKSPEMTRRERELNGMPNADMLAQQAMDEGTKFGFPQVGDTVRNWVDVTHAQMDAIGNGNVLRSAIAWVKGDVSDPWLSNMYHRRHALVNSLQTEGVSPEAANVVAKKMMESELQRHYGVQRVFDDSGKLVQELPEQARKLLEETAALPYEGSFGGVRQFNDRVKATMFGPADFSIGNQLATGIQTGGTSFILGLVNDAATALGHPLMPQFIAEDGVSKLGHYAADGLAVSQRTGGAPQDIQGAGTLFRYASGTRVGRAIDKVLTDVSDASSKLQFDTILGYMRRKEYEGNLLILHRLGKDITDPVVRASAARYANTATSFAHQATRTTRNTAEALALTSPSMTRARFATVANLLDVVPRSARAPLTPDVIMAANMITSKVISHAITVGAMDAALGTGDAEHDPSKPGFGNVTLRAKDSNGRNIVLDMQPQDAVMNAFARSVRVLAESGGRPSLSDATDIAKNAAKPLVSSASILGRVGLGLTGTAFTPGKGYQFGNASQEDVLTGLIPAPPIVTDIARGTGAGYAVAGALGQSAYPESGYAEAQRITEGGYKDYVPEQRAQFAAANPETAARLSEDTVAQGGTFGAIEERKRQDLSEQRQRDERVLSGGDWQQWKDATREAALKTLGYKEGVMREVAKRPSDEPLVNDYFAVLEAADKPWGMDWREFEKWSNTLTEEQHKTLDKYIGVGGTELQKERRVVSRELESAQWFKIRDGAWEGVRKTDPGLAQYESAEQFRETMYQIAYESALKAGATKGQARIRANDVIENSKPLERWSKAANSVEERWIKDHPKLTDRGIEFGYIKPESLRKSEKGVVLSATQ